MPHTAEKGHPAGRKQVVSDSAVPSLWDRNHRVLGYMAEGLVAGFF